MGTHLPGDLFHSGLQPERTHLAWTRTGLGFLAIAALLVRFGDHARPPALAYGAAVVWAGGGLATAIYGRLSYPRRNAHLRAGHSIAEPVALRVLSFVTGAGGLAAAAAVGSSLL